MKKLSRRQVIRDLSITGSAIMLSSTSLFALHNRKKDKLGVALVGLGYYSTDLLAPALQQTEFCHLAGIVTGTPAKA